VLRVGASRVTTEQVPEKTAASLPGTINGMEAETVDRPPAAAARTVPADRLVSGDWLANRYLVVTEVGRGGGGVVYRAFDRGTQLWVAIKALDPDKWSGRQSSEQLFRELRFGRSIQHGNVCRIHDVFETGGRWFLAMDYASAGTLRSTLSEHGVDRPLADKLADAQGVIAGLAAIHRGGLVHRDFKPENILRMSDRRLVVSDFGITRSLDQTTIITGLTGTPGYLAPERLAGFKETQASDVWSLGVVLHEILHGSRPETDRPRAAIRKTALDPRERSMRELCRACLQPDPKRRAANAITVEALLDKHLRRSRGSGPRWRVALPTVGLVVAAALTLVRFESRAPAPTRSAPAAADPGADWSRSRLIVTLSGAFCLDALAPQRLVARISSRFRATPVDIDVQRASWAEAPLPPDLGCHSQSPDGKWVLFSRPTAGGKTRVMVASGADGKNPTALMDGTHPRWLPSGREFLFVTAENRLALGDTLGGITRFFEALPAAFEIRDVAVDDRGDRAAVLAHHRLPAAETRIEVYDLRARKRLASRILSSAQTDSVMFDPVRRSFQFPEKRTSGWVWSELTSEGDSRVLGRVPGGHIKHAVRVAGGFIVGVLGRGTVHGLYRVGPDGSEQYLSGNARQFRVSPGGVLVYVQMDRFDLGRILLKRPDSPVVHLSGYDQFGEPNISADGRVVVFAHQSTGEIFACNLVSGDVAGSCRPAGRDPGLLAGPGLAVDPAAGTVAYLARETPSDRQTQRLRLLTLPDRTTRELTRLDGICSSGCQLHWPAPGQIRVCPVEGAAVTEIDVNSGQQQIRTVSGDPADACQAALAGGFRYQLRRHESLEFRLLPDVAERASLPGVEENEDQTSEGN
jgi:hypothetical protein